VPRDIVLVVDDEPIVLRSCTVAVAQAGFRPVVAENGAAGLETFIALQDEICLVLSDIIMPSVNGIEMAQSILKIRPETKILLMSGYSSDVIELQGRNHFPFIRKPFIHSMLVDKIRSVIGNAADSATSAT